MSETPLTDAFVKAHQGADPARSLADATDEMRTLERENRALREALTWLTECNFTDDNCASLEVANKRIRNVANKALNKSAK